jgi:VanZ family protein
MIADDVRRLAEQDSSMDWRDSLVKWTSTAALYLFWPGLALIVWGELTPRMPAWTEHFWDKSLHFIAYFGLASMATVVLGVKRRTLWCLFGLAALGAMLEVLQGFTGRDPAVFDEIVNCIGITAGFLVAWGFLALLKPPAQAAE